MQTEFKNLKIKKRLSNMMLADILNINPLTVSQKINETNGNRVTESDLKKLKNYIQKNKLK